MNEHAKEQLSELCDSDWWVMNRLRLEAEQSDFAAREAALDRINDDPAWAQRAYGSPGSSDTHVDRVRLYPYEGSQPTLIERLPSLDDPRIGAQERAHSATYVDVSEPHTMAECPFDPDGRRK